MLKHYKLFLAIAVLGAYGLLAGVWHRDGWAHAVAAVFGAYVCVTLLISIIRDLLRGKYGVDILALVAIVATIVAGEYLASLVVMLMLASGEALERYANGRARRELANLLHGKPKIAHIVHGGGQREDVPAGRVKIGDVVLVKTGEMVPIDGELVSTLAILDTSSLTGEALPVECKKGDAVVSGSINIDVAFQMKTTQTAEKSQYSQIIKLVKSIESRPSVFVRLADRYAVVFTLVSLGIAGMAWGLSGDFKRFAEVLVVASPCPLILAAPVAFMSGMSKASKSGIIVRSGVYLEKLAAVKSVAFDKTGTLSKGNVRVDSVYSFNKRYTERRIIQIIASCEQGATHVLARSIVKYAKVNGVRLVNVKQVRDHAGRGIDSVIDGKKVVIGNVGHLILHKIDVSRMNDIDRSAIFLVIDREIVGLVTFKDNLRKNAGEVVAKLRRMGIENISIITGDTKKAAEMTAEKIGVTDVYAACLPSGKVKVVEGQLEKPAVFVGDGVNDAPVLAAADVGIAMGAFGSTAASESAGVVVMVDNIDRVPMVIETSRRTMAVARQSVMVGIAACVVLMVVAGFGVIPAVIGAVLQEVVDVTSIISALRAHK